MGYLMDIEEASNFSGLQERTLRNYVYSCRVQAVRVEGEFYFTKEEIRRYLSNRLQAGQGRKPVTPEERRKNFDKRHGKGSYSLLIKCLNDNSMRYVDIGMLLDLTYERIGQLDALVGPSHSRDGHRRRSEHLSSLNMKELFNDVLYATFYRHAMRHHKQEDIKPFPMRGLASKFRKHAAYLGKRKVVLMTATRNRSLERTWHLSGKAYVIRRPSEETDDVYYMLDRDHFLFMPLPYAPEKHTTYMDFKGSGYYRFKDTFAPRTTSKPVTLKNPCVQRQERNNNESRGS